MGEFVRGKECHYPSCGFNPEFNMTCARVRKAYGICSGNCEGPCYVVTRMQTPHGSITGWEPRA